MKIDYKKLAICIAIPIALGALSGFITRGETQQFAYLNQPPLSPPAIIFPIVWTILYALMGIASYIIVRSDCTIRTSALRIYAVQLVFNILWPVVFFSFKLYLLAFIWLIVLFLLVLITSLLFYSCKKSAGYLMIPYILWLIFAGYLNLSIYLLN